MDIASDDHLIPTRHSDRLLWALMAAVGVLILAGLTALLLLGGRQATEFPEDRPEGIVQRYLRALDGGEGDIAYSYLSESVRDESVKRGYQRFEQYPAERTRRVLLEASVIEGEQARVSVSVSTITSDGPTSTSETAIRLEFRLKREAAGWRITAPIYPPHLGIVPAFEPVPPSVGSSRPAVPGKSGEERGPWAAL